MIKKQHILYSFVLIIGILVLLNLLSTQGFIRLDLTKGRQYTLSEVTKTTIKELNEPVSITVYFSKDVGAYLQNIRRDLKDLLKEYEIVSKRMVNFEFIDPKMDDETKQELAEKGIELMQVQERENDMATAKNAYLTIVIEMGEKKGMLPASIGAEMQEYYLTSSIISMARIEKDYVGLVQGHNEPGMQAVQGIRQSLETNYLLEAVTINEQTDLSKYKSLIIMHPTDSISAFEQQSLTNYIKDGGNIFLSYSHFLVGQQGLEMNQSNIGSWLNELGITIGNDFVVDKNCVKGYTMQRNGLQFQENRYEPIINSFSENSAITKGVEPLSLQLASTINFARDSIVNFEPLMKTSNESGIFMPMIPNQDLMDESLYSRSGLTVSAAFNGPLIEGGKDAKMVLISDGRFAFGNQQNAQNSLYFISNAVDWLSDDIGLIDLRAKNSLSQNIDEKILNKQGLKNFIKWFNFSAPILLVILLGVIIFSLNDKKRKKRMEVRYYAK